MTPAPRRRDRSAETLSPRRRREDLVSPLAGLCVALFVVVCILAGGIGYVAIDARRTAQRAETNTEGLRVACVLLSNTIVKAGAGGTRPDTPAGRAQTELTRLIYVGLAHTWTPEQRAEVARLQAVIRRAGGVVSVPPCDEIVKHPERVKSLIPPVPPARIPIHPNP